MPNLQQIADALSGFGAGTQGQGGQFAESMARRAAYAQQEKQRIEDLDKERISMMVKDAWTADKLLNENKPEVALRMLQNRVENIKRLGGDPSHTQEVIDGLTSGDPARVAQTRQDVKLFADSGIAYGSWTPPQPKIKEAKWVDGIGWTGITEGGQMVAPENTPEFQSKIAEAQKQSMKMNDYQRVSAAQRQQEIAIQQQQLQEQIKKGAPVTYQTDENGNLVAVPTSVPSGVSPTASPVTSQSGEPIRGKQQPLSEAQSNAALFGARAKEAQSILDKIGSDYGVTGLGAKKSVEWIPGVGQAANAMLSTNQQMVDQAQRDFINAILRKESGAAIGKDEFANAQRQYFPQTGDSAEVIAQKKANRETAIAGLDVASGSGTKQIESKKNTTKTVHWNDLP